MSGRNTVSSVALEVRDRDGARRRELPRSGDLADDRLDVLIRERVRARAGPLEAPF
jgi:hypothetical protein